MTVTIRSSLDWVKIIDVSDVFITAFYDVLVSVPFNVQVSIWRYSIENSKYIYNYFKEVCIEKYNEAHIVFKTTTKNFAMSTFTLTAYQYKLLPNLSQYFP